mmetsp:Transcript_29289/g.58454  ORF Transcript_29289/g.58454 Transcript_29289/m.58454 type:complete len:384 (+) Transcript_29289:58-1209(+)|eukprot:CAMPEP_0170400464 /NCGR_PEP_ID=MMETSP0117_2-20130122/24514_1 /TAXON_ID=400756 /ORGANISM="Durinskia baltica, Strain CSIRO CS-38" /LENGTH=383 /DNA_ID=CAMNT_0010657219 /DNA_START=41 /DNA_END=1192 /DNA_ORIENTATION=+
MADSKQMENPIVATPVLNPAFIGVTAVAVPEEYKGTFSPEYWGILTGTNKFTVRQHVKLLPKSCCTCPPCVKQENTYSVYAGVGSNAEAEFLRIDEVSDDWNRCCCSPYHPLRLEARPYVPIPGDGSSDFRHLTQDFQNDFSRLTGREKQQKLRTMYMAQPPAFSMVRDDGMRCCYKCPCKVLNTFVCFDCCRDGMHIYAGAVEDEPDKEKGRPFNLDPSKLIGSVMQPLYGGICTPTLHLRGKGAADTDEPFGKVEGPCFFGGWSEMCCEFRFFTSLFNSKTKEGDVAMIIKKKPASLAGAAIELMSDADVYGIEFVEGAQLTGEQKISVLTAQLLADYMYFDGNTEKCSQDDDFIYCYLCYYSFFGAICPCYIAIPKKMGG